LDLSVIVVNWNTRDMLSRCLASIYTYPPGSEFEVLVVDNASSDGSAQMVQERFPQVRSIQNRENLGFARANNLAIRESRGRYVLLLNSDTEVLSGALQYLLDFIEKHTEAGAIGPKVLNPDLTLQSSCNPMPTLGRELWHLMHLDHLWPRSIYREENWDATVAHAVEVIQGNCLLIRRKALSDVGVLDEAFFMFTEEVDLCYRLLQRGWSVYWVPMARIVHYGGQSTRQALKEMFIELHRSKVVFFRKTRGAWGSVVYKLILLLTALTRLPWGLSGLGQSTAAAQRARLYLDLLRLLPSL
jgi:GT2 family glycosyltransferase